MCHGSRILKLFSFGMTVSQSSVKRPVELTGYCILSAIHSSSKIQCHFIFGTGVSVRNSEVIKCLFDAQPVCMYSKLIRMTNNLIIHR